MTLTIDEKEKLLNKATKLFEEIKNIKIRKSIELDITRKYYPSNCRGSNSGFKYSINGYMYSFGEDINDGIEELRNYVNFKKYNGAEYINGKSVGHISPYTINALLDFIYNADYIKENIEKENNRERQELHDLLN